MSGRCAVPDSSVSRSAHRLRAGGRGVLPAGRAAVAALVTLAVVLGWAACAGGDATRARRHVVEMAGFAFTPAELRVAVGDTIVWINRDLVPHTATATRHEWDSGGLDRGDSWTYVATTPGEFSYLCTLHPAMTGKVIVEG